MGAPHNIKRYKQQYSSYYTDCLVVCPDCEKYFSNYSQKTQGLKQDEVFGCPLYFQDDCKGNLFWAKNREHLLEMEAYVSSELRTLPYRMRMVERLPAFIKEAKNREAVLKILQKWKNSYK
ncbi:hypothetical protein HHL23_07445 [Chryseobacterium sp. RP-3-3]|uniref:Uncharacterized protein n=1 Tax=Chryseobacterium antibioticum TaxID=2728847 RepID=A0A7Y0FR11_9FLAO|nr:hypothetical protein [Chryseobacterium antibioticum]NML69628.1 hypothetical protein [Chryseobacterium antibioticum]